jgi:hypothetical protein
MIFHVIDSSSHPDIGDGDRCASRETIEADSLQAAMDLLVAY